MIRNYFVVAFRNLIRNMFFSAVNFFGLAMSMTMAIIMLVADAARDELLENYTSLESGPVKARVRLFRPS